MCWECDNEFNEMSESFDSAFKAYLHHYQAGNLRDTVGQRARTAASGNQVLCDSEGGTYLASWYLAIALERLVALETSGIPT